MKSVHGLYHIIKGESDGISSPSKRVSDLVTHYQKATVFLNCSTLSPIPSVVMEASACGTAVVSTDTCAISEYVEHGVSGFLSNDENELRYYVEYLLNNPDKAVEMGMAGREIMKNKFPLSNFVNQWNEVFGNATNLIFKG